MFITVKRSFIVMILEAPSMSNNPVITIALLNELQSKGKSVGAIAQQLKVSERTIYRKLKKHEPDAEVVAFAAKLEKLIAEVPNGLCRKELQRAINTMRTRLNISRDGRKTQIVEAIRTGAQTVEDIAGDLGLTAEELHVYKTDLIEMLDELIAEKSIVKQLRGGVHNRGRKQKYIYLLASCQ